MQKSGITTKPLDRSAPNCSHIYADSFRNEHRLKQNYPLETVSGNWVRIPVFSSEPSPG